MERRKFQDQFFWTASLIQLMMFMTEANVTTVLPQVLSDSAGGRYTWSAWSAWSPCSKTCGGGVAIQERQCLLRKTTDIPDGTLPPPIITVRVTRQVSEDCPGEARRYHECNTAACPGGVIDSRADQCAAYDRRPFRGRFYTWVPYIDGDSPCTLNCRPLGQHFYASLALVADGTPCTRPGYRAICVQGVCKFLQLCTVFERYQKLAQDIRETVPASFLSRIASFRIKLEAEVGDLFEFHRPLNRCVEERLTLLIPRNFIHHIASEAAYEANCEQDTGIQPADEFKELVHVALKLRRDINTSPGHIGLNVSPAEIEAVVPKSLFMFHSVFIAGDAIINDDDSETVSEKARIKIISIAQDLIFACSKGRKMTPKHIVLASALHQTTRSKQLVDAFWRAGHCISYDQLRKFDTTLGEVTLQALDKTTGAVVPPTFNKTTNPESPTGALLHITVDNIDLLIDTLDGKNTFHATQMVAFQRGSSSTDDILKSVQWEENKSLSVPQAISNLTSAKIVPRKTLRVFSESVTTDLYCTSENNNVDKDLNLESAFILQRQSESTGVSGWTEFHKKATKKTHEIAAVGYMPLILNPAHDFDTLNTALLRSLAVADKLNQKYVILTADQDLYYRLVELRWSNPMYRERVVLRMGGLHISLNFLNAIGQHMNGSGLYEVWVESGLFGEGTALKVLNGKSYDKGMRGHKLTALALWSVILPKCRLYLTSDAKGSELLKEIDSNINGLASLLVTLEQSHFNEKMQSFALEEGNKDVNFKYW